MGHSNLLKRGLVLEYVQYSYQSISLIFKSILCYEEEVPVSYECNEP